MIYATDSSNSEECQYITFKKGILDISVKTITFRAAVSHRYSNSKSFYATLACEIMKNNSIEYIACSIGNSEYTACVIFDKDTYQYINSKEIDTGGYYYKSAILPEKMEKGLFCTYSPSKGLICLKYDITTNEISTISTTNLGCNPSPTAFTILSF